MSGPSRVRRRVAVLTVCAAIAIGLGLLLRPDSSSHALQDVDRASVGDAAPKQSVGAAESPVLAVSPTPRPEPPRRRRGVILLPDGRPAHREVLYLVPKRGGPHVLVGAPAGRDGVVDLPPDPKGSWIRAGHGGNGFVPVVLDGDALPPGDVEFRLRPGLDLLVEIEGMEDFPLDVAQVAWRAVDRPEVTYSDSIERDKTSKRFNVGHEGPIDVVAWHSRYVATPPTVRMERAEGTATFRMERGSRISVRATDEPSGEVALLVPGWIEVVRGRDVLFSDWSGGTDAEGVVHIRRAVAPGVYDVVLRLARYLTATARVQVDAADQDPVVDVRLRPDAGAGVVDIRCGAMDDGRPGTPPFRALVRDREEGAWRVAACASVEPNVVHLGPLPAGIYDVLVWTADGEVGHADQVPVASDRVETSNLGFSDGVYVDLARKAGTFGPPTDVARRPEARVVAIRRGGRLLPIISFADGMPRSLEGEVSASRRLGPYPFPSVEVDWRVGDGEPDSTSVGR